MALQLVDFGIDRIVAYGHQNITAKHRTTFEITREETVSPRGDCIIGVRADKSASTLNSKVRELLKNDSSYVFILLKCGNVYDLAVARGSSRLILESTKSLVVRRSEYIDGRTLAIRSNKAAYHIKRELVHRLRSGCRLEVFLIVAILDRR